MAQDRYRPLTARSVVASLLLGTKPPRLPGSALVRAAGAIGCAEGTVRVALSRMAAAGDLLTEDGWYELGDALVDRQRYQDAGRRPPRADWDGTWVLAIVGGGGPRTAAARTALRRQLGALHLAEWREGVWTRPDNVSIEWPDIDGCTWATGAYIRIDEWPRLWDVATWATEARRLLRDMGADRDLGFRFTVAAAVVRHLRDDPHLPDEMLPKNWPGRDLRSRYDSYEAQIQRSLRPVITG